MHVGKSLVDSVLTTPKGISECRKNLQFTNSLDKDQRCAVKRVKKRKMINDILEGANRNVCSECDVLYVLVEFICRTKLVRKQGLQL